MTIKNATTQRAKALRNNPTEAEKTLWQHIRAKQLGVKFRRQHPIPPYFVDFISIKAKLIIELDGGQHSKQKDYDRTRTKLLESKGYKVLRFWNNDVLTNIDGVMETIKQHIVSPSPASEHATTPKKSGLDRLRIQGGTKLNGTIPVSGAKNAALPLMCASILTGEALQLTNAPTSLLDISSLTALLEELGVRTAIRDDGLIIMQAAEIKSHVAPYELVRKMRASVLVLGPLLARCGKAEVSLPGGCAIGTRPVDLHISAMEALGAEITLEGGYIKAVAPNGLQGARHKFPKVSVGATENVMMAATLAKGTTVLENVAKEPEIIDLGECLIAMGAKIEGLGTDTLTIHGVKKLGGTVHDVVPDRIEAGTWMIGVALTGGELRLKNARLEHLSALVTPLEKAGLKIEQDGTDIIVSRNGRPLVGTDIMTEPYPGFPTDLQAQFMTMLTFCEGAGLVTETIFENRFMHVPELCRMGANITVHNGSAIIRGVPKLHGAEVMATDLRASVALVLAALVSDGETIVNRIYHLDRGYENIVEKLSAVGAQIERIPPEDK